MSFNNTFQKNKRFWMAAILMVCIITFVFCGMPAINEDFIGRIFNRGGDTVAKIGGKSVNSKQLHALKAQRELADHLMKFCVTEAFNKISKTLAEEQKKVVPDKEMGKRRDALAQLVEMQRSLAYRKSRPYYFESGRKFDDLTEFMLWQAQADAMGIHLEREHIDFLYQMEFFKQLSDQEIRVAEIDAQRTFHGTSQQMILKAIGEEFRVRIAQYAVIQAQPYSFFSRSKKADEGYSLKFTEPEVPDEIRAPMTLAQLWDVYKSERAEFNVTLLPIRVEDFVKKVEEPTDIDKASYFKLHNKPFDPTSPNRGVEVPSRIQIAYVYADPASPAYLNQAKAKALLEVTSPLFFSPMESSVGLAARYMFASEAEMKMHLARQYEALSRSRGSRYAAPQAVAGAGLSSMAAYHSQNYPQAAASIVAGSFLTPDAGFSALAGYVAWGATKHPSEIAAGNRAVLSESAPIYASMLPASPFNQPLEVAAWAHLLGKIPPGELPVQVVQAEIRDMAARRQAEEWARENMQVVKRALEGATGDAEKFKRVLAKLVPELKLTYGPTGEAKGKFYHRYAVDEAEEFKPLKDAFGKYVDMINFFEGRDLKPDTLLKSSDFYKMFFDSAEHFSASSQHRAMTWPPVVLPNKARAWKNANPRLINQQNIAPEVRQDFNQHLLQADPRKDAPTYDLFTNAEKPILFWRVAETEPVRPTDYKKIDEELASIRESLKELDQQMKKADNPTALANLKTRSAKLKFTEADLQDISNKITAGWKFERARTGPALTKAKEIAEALIKADNDPNVLFKEAKALDRELIPLEKLSRMYPERLPNFDTDYFDYPLPKPPFAGDYPRDDMGKQLVDLYDLKAQVEIKGSATDLDAAEIDKANKALFEMVKGQKNPQGKYVQILTNKPRSVFYVAVVTAQAKADRQGFIGALTAAPFERRFARDHFVTRAQQMEGRQMRAAMVRYIGDTIGYSIESTKVRDDFDKVSSD